MALYRIIRGHGSYVKHFYKDDNSFTYDYYDYERDEYNGRCYRLEPSENMHDPEMDGALVKHRISRKLYEELLEKAKKACLVANKEVSIL